MAIMRLLICFSLFMLTFAHAIGKDRDFSISASVGANAFVGDHSDLGSFKNTISPRYSLGLGLWCTSAFGLRIEGAYGDSRGFSPYEDGFYSYGPVIDESWTRSNSNLTIDIEAYRATKIKWFSASGWLMINWTRVFMGPFNKGSRRHYHQIITGVGIGMARHLNREPDARFLFEPSAHCMLQYSKFFSPSHQFSLDVRVMADLYSTYFDNEHGQFSYAANYLDYNLALTFGATWYFNRKGVAHPSKIKRQSSYNGIYDDIYTDRRHKTATEKKIKPDNQTEAIKHSQATTTEADIRPDNQRQARKHSQATTTEADIKPDNQTQAIKTTELAIHAGGRIKYDTINLSCGKQSLIRGEFKLNVRLPDEAIVTMVQIEGNLSDMPVEYLDELIRDELKSERVTVQLYQIPCSSDQLKITIHYMWDAASARDERKGF